MLGPSLAEVSDALYRAGMNGAELPIVPPDQPLPGLEWDRADAPGDAAWVTADVAARCIDDEATFGLHLALVVIHRGRLVAEHYGPTADADTTLISWSMAKSVVHALVGICVRDGLLDIDAPAPVAAWQHDERRAITIAHLLSMTSGLRFREDYVDAGVSDVIEMLFGAGQHDVAGFAIDQPLEHQPGTIWNYSSGTTNILARIVGDVVGGGEAGMRAFLARELFEPIGMASADPRFDMAGTFIGSSYLYCTALDFARFGELYRRDGVWADRRVLPAGWAAHARTPVPVAVPDDEPFGYGNQWWLWDRAGVPGAFGCHGYEQQRIVVVPDRDLVVVRLGKTVAELEPNLRPLLREIIEAFPTR